MPNSPRSQMLFGLSVINEVSSATQLLATGLNQIVERGWISREPASAFTCLASGVERLMKLTYGLDVLNNDGSFPGQAGLRQLGHSLIAVHGIVLPDLAAHAAKVGNLYVLRLLSAAASDPYWPGILAALDAWAAAAGRYRDLNILAGKVVADDPPWALWEEVERRCVDDLGLLTDLTGPDNRSAVVAMRTRLAESVLKWWFAVFRSWTHGLIGNDSKSPGTLLSPASSLQLAEPLAQLVKGW